MSNIIQIKRGGGVPEKDQLAPYELGYSTDKKALYIRDDKNNEVVKVGFNENGPAGEYDKSLYPATPQDYGAVSSSANITKTQFLDWEGDLKDEFDNLPDSTEAFKSALAENRVVHVPGGVYKLSGPIDINYNSCLELSQDTTLIFNQTFSGLTYIQTKSDYGWEQNDNINTIGVTLDQDVGDSITISASCIKFDGTALSDTIKLTKDITDHTKKDTYTEMEYRLHPLYNYTFQLPFNLIGPNTTNSRTHASITFNDKRNNIGETKIFFSIISSSEGQPLRYQYRVVPQNYCIGLHIQSSLKGNNASIIVPDDFSGNVLFTSTEMTERKQTDVLGFGHWDPQWKQSRYINDICIRKPNQYGLHYPIRGSATSGNGIFVYTDWRSAEDNSQWANQFTGIRIAGPFNNGFISITDEPYGKDDNAGVFINDAGWNYETRFDGIIESCKVGVNLYHTGNTYLSVLIQPHSAADGTLYCYQGIRIVRSRNVDTTGSHVWDWHDKTTLRDEYDEAQHMALYGNCYGLIISDPTYWYHREINSVVKDLRDLIYTNYPDNLTHLVILQEPITRFFNPKSVEQENGEIKILPYFVDWDEIEKELLLKEEYQNTFQTTQIPDFTNLISTSIDKDGSIFYEKGYQEGVRWNFSDAQLAADGYYSSTGFIPVRTDDIVRCTNMSFITSENQKGYTGVIVLDKNFNKVSSATYYQFLGQDGNGNPVGSYPTWMFPFPNGEAPYPFTENDILLKIGGSSTEQYYIAFTVPMNNLKGNPIITVNEEIIYTTVGTLAENIKVNASSIVGDTSSLIASADAVSFKPQTANSEERKAQARENIGAVSITDYNTLLARVQALENQLNT